MISRTMSLRTLTCVALASSMACGPLEPRPATEDASMSSTDMGAGSESDMSAGSEPDSSGGGFTTPTEPTPVTVRAITVEGYGSVSAAQFSPDGNKLALIARADAQSEADLIVTDTNGGGVISVLSGSELLRFDSDVRWLPSGEALLFSTRGEIYRVAAVEAGATELVLDLNTLISGFDLSPDAKTLMWGDARGLKAVLSRATYDGSVIERDEITELGAGHVPSYSPDGSRIAYNTFGVDATTVVTGADLSGERIELEGVSTALTVRVGWLTPERILLTGVNEVLLVDLSARTAESLSGVGYASYLDVSDDGTRALVTTTSGLSELSF